MTLRTASEPLIQSPNIITKPYHQTHSTTDLEAMIEAADPPTEEIACLTAARTYDMNVETVWDDL